MRDLDADIAIRTGAVGLQYQDRADASDKAEQTLEAIYDQYLTALYRYALALVGSADDAEDAVQEVFVRIARERKCLRSIENIKPYLYAATRNAAFGLLRSRRRKDTLQSAVCSELLTGVCEDALGRFAESTAICQAFAELPADQREVLVLKLFDQMTFKEVAETVGASINTVASRYRYALDKLRQALEENGNG